MMRMRISHVSEYHYERPQHHVVQSYQLHPADTNQQRILDWSVRISDGRREDEPILDYVNSAGNQVSHLSFHKAITSLKIQVKGSVETTDHHGIMRHPRERISPLVYLQPTCLTTPDEQFFDLLAGWNLPNEPLAKAHALNTMVHEIIAYQSDSTTSEHTAAEALRGGRGVCQDQSHVLLTFARLCNIPARYVVGYLFTDAAGNRHEESHAWSELYVENLGWVGFDATNKTCTTQQYVRVSSGADAIEASPIRGIARSFQTGQETLKVKLRIDEMQLQQ